MKRIRRGHAPVDVAQQWSRRPVGAEAALAAWPLLPAACLRRGQRQVSQRRAQPPAAAPALPLAPLPLFPSSQVWWPRWLWVLPRATLWVMSSLGASVGEAVLSPQGLTSLTRSLRDPGCSRMAPASMTWNSFWSVPRARVTSNFVMVSVRCWNSADWPMLNQEVRIEDMKNHLSWPCWFSI